MKTLLLILIAIGVCAAFLLLPHHHRKPSTFKACTLAEIYRDLFREIPTLLRARTQVFFLLALFGVMACLFPACLVLIIRWLPRAAGERGGGYYVLVGLIVVVGALTNWVLILVSHMSFGWGSSSSTGDETIGFFLVPLAQIMFAIVSIGIGVSARLSDLSTRLVLP